MTVPDDPNERLAPLADKPSCASVLDQGFVRVVETWGSDSAIEDAARVSYSAGDPSRARSDTVQLLRYLMRHRHTTPFEMAGVKLHIRCPMFVAVQWIRHRTASINMFSTRYSEVDEDKMGFWWPEGGRFRKQSTTNKQGSEEGDDSTFEHEPVAFTTPDGKVVTAEEAAYLEYAHRIEAGMSREQARSCLPEGRYTEFYWQMNLHNLMHFLGLRMDAHAQQEIRDYARAIYDLVSPLYPITFDAFDLYVRRAERLTLMEQGKIRMGLTGDSGAQLEMSEREKTEWQAKVARMVKRDLNTEPTDPLDQQAP